MNRPVLVLYASSGSKRALLLKKQFARLNLVGYTDQISRLLAQNDAIITKPGGLICSESIATRTPLILFGPGFGQEKANQEFLVNNGLALTCRDIPQLLRALHVLKNSPQTVVALSQNMANYTNIISGTWDKRKFLSLPK